eukprot:229680-Pyramimonas_sp.AAC.1
MEVLCHASKSSATRRDMRKLQEMTQGGHLLGVVDKLQYLEDLGVNTLYLTPVNTSSTESGMPCLSCMYSDDATRLDLD